MCRSASKNMPFHVLISGLEFRVMYVCNNCTGNGIVFVLHIRHVENSSSDKESQVVLLAFHASLFK